jgi:hypothetical protein
LIEGARQGLFSPAHIKEMKEYLQRTKNFIASNKWEIIIFAYILFYLSYTLKGAFYGDDAISYYYRGDFILGKYSSIFDIVGKSIVDWLHSGRFFPLSSYSIFIFYFLTNSVVYKLVSIVCVAVNVLMFGNLVKKITGSTKTKLVMMLFTTLFFQIFTTYHNAILSYHMFMQVLFGLFMLILIYLYKYIHQNNRKYLIISVICFIASLLLYEISFVFIVIIFFFILMYEKSFREVFRRILPYASPLVAIGLVNIVIKAFNTSPYSGITASFEPGKIIITAIKQTVAAFPLSDYIFNANNGTLGGSFSAVLQNITVLDILIAVIFLYILFSVWRLKDGNDLPQRFSPARTLPFWLFCICMFVLPGILLSVSQKYQSELFLGVGYLPVYIQYFGLLLVFYCIYASVKNTIANNGLKPAVYRASAVIGVILLVVITLLNQQNMRLYIDSANRGWLYPKEVAVSSIESGILDGITENDVLYLDEKKVWDSDSFFSEYANRKIHIQEAGSLGPIENAYIMKYFSNEHFGAAIVGKLQSVSSGEEKQAFYANDILISLYDTDKKVSNIYYKYMDNNETAERIIPVKQLKKVKKDNHILYQLSDEQIELSSIKFVM